MLRVTMRLLHVALLSLMLIVGRASANSIGFSLGPIDSTPSTAISEQSSYELFLPSTQLFTINAGFVGADECAGVFPNSCSNDALVMLSGPLEMLIEFDYSYSSFSNNIEGFYDVCPGVYNGVGGPSAISCWLPAGNYVLSLQINDSSDVPITGGVNASVTGDFVVTPEPATGILILLSLTTVFLKTHSATRKPSRACTSAAHAA
jgi:hypothetical protein